MELTTADFDDFRAAPLLIVGEEARPELIASQDALSHNFKRVARHELGPYVKPNLITTFVIPAIVSRMNQREGLNGVSYLHRKHKTPQLGELVGVSEEEMNAACENIQYGRGTVAQNEIARQAFGMLSAEYANLTIVKDFRRELEPHMWDEVGELIGTDASPHFDQMYGLQVLGFDRDIAKSSHVGAMRIGMKRRLGMTKYGAQVKARTTAIVNMSPSACVDQSLVERIRQAKSDNEDIAKLPEFLNAVRWLVDSELPSGLILARNETIYGVKSKE